MHIRNRHSKSFSHHCPKTALGVTVQLQSGARYAEERVSPLKTLGELYDTLVGGQAAGAGPVVAMDFADIGGDDASSSPLAASGGAWTEWDGMESVGKSTCGRAKAHAPHPVHVMSPKTRDARDAWRDDRGAAPQRPTGRGAQAPAWHGRVEPVGGDGRAGGGGRGRRGQHQHEAADGAAQRGGCMLPFSFRRASIINMSRGCIIYKSHTP